MHVDIMHQVRYTIGNPMYAYINTSVFMGKSLFVYY